MSNSTIPAASAAANLPLCPPWCDSRYCRVTDSDVEHRAAPVTVETLDATYTLTLQSVDELGFPTQWGGIPAVMLHAESKAYAATPGGEPMCLLAELATAETPRLIAALAELLARAGGDRR